MLRALLSPEAQVQPLRDGVVTVLPPDRRAAAYDRLAPGYDLLVGSRIYNRLVWGSSPAHYAQLAATALIEGHGPALDVGAGSLVFTAEIYAATARPLILTDLSGAMLGRGARRLASKGRAIQTRRHLLLQADAAALPLRDHTFDTVMSWGFLHLFHDPAPLLAELRRVTAPGGRVHLSVLTLGGGAGDAVLRRLEARGEVYAAAPAYWLGAVRRGGLEVTDRAQEGHLLSLSAALR
ncbi:MAG: class I SAM-dependent methyltransferase [Deltaproteobacteria bacterium]|nr:class I SAM-dependent methyltransferase [Deltaproteobacteria bacterium]